ncbi:MAG: hypothetical protein GDA56_28790 [Hormoscilla sp. GM7CHS1pb]|nr:hypothetical protein [Hormoscilla sp. GM7CHS1pb]
MSEEVGRSGTQFLVTRETLVTKGEWQALRNPVFPKNRVSWSLFGFIDNNERN